MSLFSNLARIAPLVLLLTGAFSARALTITDTTKGGVYTLEIESLGGTSYLATYSIDLASVPLEIPATSLNQIEFKVANDYGTVVTVTSAPDLATNWVPMAGPLTGPGCGGTNDGFVCLSASTPLSLGSTTSFSWQVEFEAASLLPVEDWHIGARYTSPNHPKGWVVSLPGSTAVPEPASALLLGVGGLVVGAAARKRLD